MSISYDIFTDAFLNKIKEYNFLRLDDSTRTTIVDDYMKKACARFGRICRYDILNGDDENRSFNITIPDSEIDDIVDIVSEGMVMNWMKPYVYKQENLENALNTTDFSGYSPAELLHRINETYANVKKDFINMIKNYSYDYGDLSDLSL